MRAKLNKIFAMAAAAMMITVVLVAVGSGEGTEASSSNGVTINDDYVTISKDGTSDHIPGGCGDALKVEHTGTDVKITMTNLTLEYIGQTYTSGINYYAEFLILCDFTTLEIVGTNTITLKGDSTHTGTDNFYSGLFCSGILKIVGTGTLNVDVENNSNNTRPNTIMCNSMFIDGKTTVNATCGDNIAFSISIYAVSAPNGLYLSGGATMTAVCGNVSERMSSVYAIEATPILVEGGSTLKATSGNTTVNNADRTAGIESSSVIVRNSILEAKGGSNDSGGESFAIFGIQSPNVVIDNSKVLLKGKTCVIADWDGNKKLPVCTNCTGAFVSNDYTVDDPTDPLLPSTQAADVKVLKTTAEIQDDPVVDGSSVDMVAVGLIAFVSVLLLALLVAIFRSD